MKERGLAAYQLSRMGGVSKQLIYILVKAQHNKVAVDSVYQVVIGPSKKIAKQDFSGKGATDVKSIALAK